MTFRLEFPGKKGWLTNTETGGFATADEIEEGVRESVTGRSHVDRHLPDTGPSGVPEHCVKA
jgi:hypothetical protein